MHGVVCTKSVAHKKMKQQISNPRILLLRSPIEYQRIENKFCSLEPQILQVTLLLLFERIEDKFSSLEPQILQVNFLLLFF